MSEGAVDSAFVLTISCLSRNLGAGRAVKGSENRNRRK